MKTADCTAAYKTVSDKVADYVRDLIIQNGLKRDECLPSYSELAATLRCNRRTAMRGMDILVAEGAVRRQRAQGCFVNREISRQGRALKTIGIVHTSSTAHLFSHRYLQKIMQGIGDAPGHLDIQIYCMRGDGFVTAAQLADRHVDGVILLGMESDAFVEEFATWGVPGVLVDQVSEKGELDCVACDNEAAARRAVRHLVEQGHRRIRYVALDPRSLVQVGRSRTLLMRSSDRVERHDAAQRALAAVPGMVRDEDILANTIEDSVFRHVVATWRDDPQRPTAALVEDDMMAEKLTREMRRMGLSAPEDISLCAIASVGDLKFGEHPLACNRVDFTGMGRKAVEVLRRRCEEPAKAPAPQVYRVGSEWVEGRSTREARA